MKHVYIAGPYTLGDTIENTRQAVAVADELAAMGWAVYIPHAVGIVWHFLRPHEYDFWLTQDIAWLLKCDVLARLPGESPGADAEVSIAQANGIIVCHWPADMMTLRTLANWTPVEEAEFSFAPDD